MNIKEYIKENIVYLDGGMGTLLQENGLRAGELPERLNIERPELITSIHESYLRVGSNVISTNTFGANSLKFSDSELEEIIKAAIANARRAIRNVGGEHRFVALDIGPSGRMLAPYGDLAFEDTVALFAKTVRLGVKYGADLVFIETMNDSYETKAALLAAKENCDLPVFVSNAYGEDGKLMTGASPLAMIAMLEGLGADAIGVNCSLGPKALAGVVGEYLKYSSLPVLFKPNAGLPRAEHGKTVYDISPAEFAREVLPLAESGVRAVGGCCGTTPEYISAVVDACKDIKATPFTYEKKPLTVVSSYNHAVTFGERPVLIGERINPTGKKRFKEALVKQDMDYILNEGVAQQERGVHILDVNVGLPEINECEMLTRSVRELQAIIDLPLQLDTSDARAMESAMRIYNGKALINSVNGKRESMEAVFPLVKKYGGVVVALTLDESGIPASAEGRVAIAKNILAEAQKYGIDKRDIIFDPLAMTISADNSSALAALGAIKEIRHTLGVHTSLGVSNISFGLPARDAVNSTFFALALQSGLSAAIMNPYSAEMMKTYYAYNALAALDANCAEYIAFAQSLPTDTPTKTTASVQSATDVSGEFSPLAYAIIKGRHEQAAVLCAELIGSSAPLDIVQNEIIPALNKVGTDFESNKVYLPQLLMSAEAAKAAFEVIKANIPKAESTESREVIILATVKGDIHDIGKNIVKLLLENYGFDVRDLGRDVPPEAIVKAAVELHAPLVGLSALMTTTVPAMEETIALLRSEAPWCKTVVGGAVLTEEYARTIGADRYSKDAMETVRYAEELLR